MQDYFADLKIMAVFPYKSWKIYTYHNVNKLEAYDNKWNSSDRNSSKETILRWNNTSKNGRTEK